MPHATRVFISYAQESEAHKAWVLGLAARLRAGGVDAWIDQYEPFPTNGWRAWMDGQIQRADWVLVVCTKEYLRRFNGNTPPDSGRGVRHESMHITQQLYDNKYNNCKYVPVLPPDEKPDSVPCELRDFNRYALEDGYEALHRLLVGQHPTPPPPLVPLPIPEIPPSDAAPTNEAKNGRNGLPPLRRVLIGKCTSDLAQARQDLMDELARLPGLEVDGDSLTLDLISDYDNEGDLAGVMSRADYLVIPISMAKPHIPSIKPAGHLTIQKTEWERLQKPTSIIWYRPNLAPSDSLASDACKAFIESLPFVQAIENILLQLEPPKGDTTKCAYIYIEGGNQDTNMGRGRDDREATEPTEPNAWKILGCKISEVWRTLGYANPESPVNLHLYYRRLDIERLEPLPEDINAIVLLLGAKPTTTLLSNISKVEKALTRKRGRVLPGLVAELIPPRSEVASQKEARNGWDFTRFRNNDTSRRDYGIDVSDLCVLEAFLAEVRDDVIRSGRGS